MDELKIADGNDPIRSLSKTQQNKYLQVLFKYFGSCLGYRREEVEWMFFKYYVNRDIYICETSDEFGLPEIKVKRLLEPSREELSEAIERFLNYASMVAGVYLPLPNESDAINECNQVIKQNKMFI